MSDDTIELIRSLDPFPSELPAPPIELLLNRLDPATDDRAATLRRMARIRPGGALGAVLATAVAAAVAIFATVLIGHTRTRETARPHPAAQIPGGGQPLTSILEVLRRPQTADDRDPRLIRLRQRDDNDKYTLAFEGRPVRSLLRLATVAPWGQRIDVVPFLAPTAQAKRRLPRKERGVTVAATAGLVTYPVSGGNGVPAMIEGGRDIGNGDYGDGAKPAGIQADHRLGPTTTSSRSPRPIFEAPDRRSGTELTARSSSGSPTRAPADHRSVIARDRKVASSEKVG